MDNQENQQVIGNGIAPNAQPPPAIQVHPRVGQHNPYRHMNVLHVPIIPIAYKNHQDLDQFLLRFDHYCTTIQAQDNNKVNILSNLLDEDTFNAVDRYMRPDINYNEFVEVLRRSKGLTNPNRMQLVEQLRQAKREKNENVRDFFTRLYHLSKKAYDDAHIREHELRETFLLNMEYPSITERLREHHEYNNDEIVELAVTLESCKTHQAVAVNAVSGENESNSMCKVWSALETLTRAVHRLEERQLKLIQEITPKSSATYNITKRKLKCPTCRGPHYNRRCPTRRCDNLN